VDDAERLGFVRAELRFELTLLHDRVNALLTAEAFLTIAYTAAMSNGARGDGPSPPPPSSGRSCRSSACCSPCWPGPA